MRHIILSLLTSILIIGLSACGGGSSSGVPIQQERGRLVSAKLLSHHDKATINRAIEGSLFAVAASIQAKYDVDTYKIIYETETTDGSIISVSGLLAVPNKTMEQKSPLLSNQHGTIFLNKNAPSFNHGADEVTVISASLGYITTEPDYIGYGESAGVMHTWTLAEPLAHSVVDMLRATKTFLFEKNILINKQLFLMGYSEGGYATLAAQKEIEADPAGEFTVTASVPAEGVYDLSRAAKKALSTLDAFVFPAYTGFFLRAYDDAYSFDFISDSVQSPYDEVINTHFDGTHTGEEINSKLISNPALLFKDSFIQAYLNGERSDIESKIVLNDLYDWKPKAPTRLFAGQDDQTAPFSSSEFTLKTMQENGATDVALIVCDAGGLPTNHNNCFLPSILYSASFFSGFVNDL